MAASQRTLWSWKMGIRAGGDSGCNLRYIVLLWIFGRSGYAAPARGGSSASAQAECIAFSEATF